jgi:hypothetical protein
MSALGISGVSTLGNSGVSTLGASGISALGISDVSSANAGIDKTKSNKTAVITFLLIILPPI